jgi:N-methylhydantoinase A/oxoprolinase/acetone carboxylase beta subunit
MLDWPSDLREAVNGGVAMVRGGHEYTGEEIDKLDEESLRKAVKNLAEKGVEALAITSVFSIVNLEHEERAKEPRMYPRAYRWSCHTK